MSAIGKGDWVQCITPVMLNGIGAQLGHVYCVEAIDPCPPWGGECDACGPVEEQIVLVGVRLPPDYGFCHCAFKPLGGQHDAEAVETRVCEPA